MKKNRISQSNNQIYTLDPVYRNNPQTSSRNAGNYNNSNGQLNSYGYGERVATANSNSSSNPRGNYKYMAQAATLRKTKEYAIKYMTAYAQGNPYLKINQLNQNLYDQNQNFYHKPSRLKTFIQGSSQIVSHKLQNKTLA